MKKLIIILLLTLLINANFTTNANAFGGEIRIILRAIAKFLKGGADDSIKAGSKTLDDVFKRVGQSPEEAILSKTDKVANLKTLTKDESLILDLLQGRVFKNDRSIKSKYVEHGLDKEHPHTVIVISSLGNKDLVRNTLLTLVEEREDIQCM